MGMENIFENVIISDIVVCCDIHTAPHEKRTIVNRSSHGLIFSTDGKVNYRHADNHFYTDPQHFLFVPSGITYSLEGEREDVSYVLNFKCNVPFDEMRQLALPDAGVLEDAKKAVEIFNKKYFNWQTAIRTLLYRIMSSFFRQSADTLPPHMENCIRFLRNNLENPALTNDAIARQANISAVYMQKEFLRYLGIPPHQYLQSLRIDRAKYLLISRPMSITEIAYATGYVSVYHFSRMFKKLTGLSPKQYRAKNLFDL